MKKEKSSFRSYQFIRPHLTRRDNMSGQKEKEGLKMYQNLIRIIIVAFAVATASAIATPCYAAAGCSSSDQQLISSYSEAAVKAFVSRDLKRYVNLMQELEAKVSSNCRAELAQSEPRRGKCSLDERKTVLSHYQAIIKAAWNGDINRLFLLFENLEESLSRPCWIALNRSQDARVQKTCSSSEVDLIASYSGPMTRSVKQFLISGDVSQLIGLQQDMYTKISPACQTALANVQKSTQNQPGSREYLPPGVLDHGGGTYSVPGMGACTSSGCMAY
jgi:hypothetical protein